MENLANRNNVTFDGNQQNIDSRVSKLCSTILLWRTICVLFSFSLSSWACIRMYAKSVTINLTKCVEMLFSNLYKWIKQQQQQQKGKNPFAKEKRNERNELTAYSMAKHPNRDRVLRTTRADIKKVYYEQAIIEMNENISKKSACVWVIADSLTSRPAGWLTGRSCCYIADVINY